MSAMNTTISMKKFYTKKSFLIIITIALFLILLGIIGIFLLSNSNEKVQVLNYKKNYVVQSIKEDIIVNCFVDKKKEAFLDKTKIKSLYLLGQSKEEIKVTLKNITKKEEKMLYQEKEYYQYDITFNVPITCDETLFLENAILRIITSLDKVDLPLGTITILEESSNANINIVKAMGIVNSIGQMDSLTGVYLKLRSIDDYIEIKDIVALSPCVAVSKGLIQEMSEPSHTMNLKEIYPDYECYNLYDGDINIRLDGETKGFLIPLKYNYQTFINQLAFKVIYKYHGKTMTEVLPAYKYFSSNVNYDVINVQEI